MLHTPPTHASRPPRFFCFDKCASARVDSHALMSRSFPVQPPSDFHCKTTFSIWRRGNAFLCRLHFRSIKIHLSSVLGFLQSQSPLVSGITWRISHSFICIRNSRTDFGMSIFSSVRYWAFNKNYFSGSGKPFFFSFMYRRD